MDTNLEYLEAASEIGVERIEFYTGKYAEEYIINREKIIEPFINAANKCEVLGLGINAGHDLNLENLQFFKENIPSLLEVSIGHALITDCLYFGLENVIPMYLRLINKS